MSTLQVHGTSIHYDANGFFQGMQENPSDGLRSHSQWSIHGPPAWWESIQPAWWENVDGTILVFIQAMPDQANKFRFRVHVDDYLTDEFESTFTIDPIKGHILFDCARHLQSWPTSIRKDEHYDLVNLNDLLYIGLSGAKVIYTSNDGLGRLSPNDHTYICRA